MFPWLMSTEPRSHYPKCFHHQETKNKYVGSTTIGGKTEIPPLDVQTPRRRYAHRRHFMLDIVILQNVVDAAGNTPRRAHVGRRHDIDMIGRLAYRYRLKGYPHSRRVCRRHNNGCMISRIKNTGAVVHAEIRECLTPVYRFLKS